MRLLGIDPGGTIGWAILDEPLAVKDSGQLKLSIKIGNLVQLYRPDEIVIEEFRPRPIKAKAISSQPVVASEVTGYVEEMARMYGSNVVRQAPAIKASFSDPILKLYGCLVDGRHARDAVRHALYRSLFGHSNHDHPEVQAILKAALGS